MWPFAKQPDKAGLNKLKPVRVNGFRYVIRRLNPLLDLPSDSIPQLFADHQSRRKQEPSQDPSPEAMKKMQESMYAVVRAGLAEPKLVAVGKGEDRGHESGITIDDLFRDDTGAQLYWAILLHSMNRFAGLRGIFFSIAQRFRLYTLFAKNMGNDQARWFLRVARQV